MAKREKQGKLKRFIVRLASRFLSLKIISDRFAIKTKYFLLMKRKLDLKNPKTFNEKLNWMKLYLREPVFSKMVDKYEAKQLVADKLGEEYVIPSIGIYNSWDEIDFDKLEAPFVIKTTHASGVVFVIRDKSQTDWKNIKKIVNRSLKTNYFYSCREWPYKNVKPRILIESFVQDSKEKNLPVFKFFCFSGEPNIVQTIKNDKTSYETIDYFDMDWNRLDLKQNFENSEIPLDKPVNFEEMKDIARKLSKGFPFIRIDLFSIDGKIYFSEFTFYTDAAYQRFYPDLWDKVLGDKIDLNSYEPNYK